MIPRRLLQGWPAACLLAALALTVPARAADLDGIWRMDIRKASGVTLRNYVILHQHGATIEGSVFANSSWQVPIKNAHLDGDDIVFQMDWGWKFRIRPEGPNLHVLISYDGGGKDEAVAIPAPASEMNPPAKIDPPALADLHDNGLARTPPMGWNSWNHFAERVDDRVVRGAADAMVASGMAAAGYVYINIDDTWEAGRDAQGNIVPNLKFPDMKALADYVHSKGLKLGIYSSPGPLTCGGYPGSYGHEVQDANTYASWGIDYLKYDWCSAGRIYHNADLRAIYQRMGDALRHSGRDIVFSLCEYGMGDVWSWAPKVGGNLWRTTGDISDNWKSMTDIGFNQGRLAPFAGPGHWNDPDMLEVGNGGMTADEYRTHFSLWSMLAAPLMAGNDLSAMSEETRVILTNREVIAIDQDALGREAVRAFEDGGIDVWTRSLADGSLAVGIFNRSADAAKAAFPWGKVGLAAAPASIRELWSHSAVAQDAAGFSGTVPGHGVVLLRVK
jgi:alpha-galactosidase